MDSPYGGTMVKEAQKIWDQKTFPVMNHIDRFEIVSFCDDSGSCDWGLM